MMILTIMIGFLLVSLLIWWNDKLYSKIESINFKLQDIRKELDTNSHLVKQNTCTINNMNCNMNQIMCEQEYSSHKMKNFEKSTEEEIKNIKNQITKPYMIV